MPPYGYVGRNPVDNGFLRGTMGRSGTVGKTAMAGMRRLICSAAVQLIGRPYGVELFLSTRHFADQA
jgi:hypothetical protein